MSEAHWIDGNGCAGLLAEAFGAEVTALVRGCGTCGQRHPIGAHRAYRGAGVVLRCPGCGDLALRIVALPGRHAVLARGEWQVELPRPG